MANITHSKRGSLKGVLKINTLRKKMLSLFIAVCIILTQAVLSIPASAYSTRIYGVDRYKTSVSISQQGWTNSYYAVIARGDDFPDALCAGPLAQKYNAPILLTETWRLNPDVITELKRLGVSYVFIVGGSGAISYNVETALRNAGIYSIERIYGANRYETSAKIAEKVGSTGSIVLATGNDFPDALSISAIAAKKGMPILLTEKDKLPYSTQQFIKNNSISQTYIIGGTGVISDWVRYSATGAVRLSGNDRYETNVAVLQQFAGELDFNKVYVAVGDGPNGDEFADALTGAVLAAKTSSPLILAGKTLPTVTSNYLRYKINPSTRITALGGESVVPSSVVRNIENNNSQYSSGITAAVYNSSGTYGPYSGTNNVTGDVTISAANVTLQNMSINGNLVLSESIGTGSVYLRNVTVSGTTTVKGGGPNSVNLYDFSSQYMVVDTYQNDVRIVSQGNTNINYTTMQSGGRLEEYGLTANGFVTVVVTDNFPVTLSGIFGTVNLSCSGANVSLESGSIGTLNVESAAANSRISLSSGTNVDTLTVDASSNINGQGQIYRADVNASGTYIEKRPSIIDIEYGIGASVGGQYMTGSTQYDNYYDYYNMVLYAEEDTVTINANEYYYAGNNIYNPSGASLTYYSSNPNISVDRYTGLITSSTPGETSVITAYGSISNLSNRTVSFNLYVSSYKTTVTGVEDGKTYGTSVNADWSVPSNVISAATLSKDGGTKVSYSRGTDISENGDYVLEVIATSTINGMKSTTTVRFTIDKAAPSAPTVTGVVNDAAYNAAVTPTWTDASGTTSTATLKKNSGTAASYTKGTAISDSGSYELTVTSKKTSNNLTASTTVKFTINGEAPTAPSEPVVTGVAEGATYGTTVTPTWTDASGTTSTALLKKNSGTAAAYTKGTAISDNGSYELTVIVTKTANGLIASKTIRFTVDKAGPSQPAVTGVDEGEVYTAPVTPTWTDAAGTTSTATLKMDNGTAASYTKGTSIPQDGSYVLTVTATKTINNLTAAKTINFTIDQAAPAAPIVTGVTEGSTNSAPVSAAWADAAGTTSTAILKKVGGTTTVYTKGTAISASGDYELIVTARKTLNGLTALTTVNFTIE